MANHIIDTDRGSAVNISIGFNPQDFSVGHHSIKRLHSHVRTISNQDDLARRHQYLWHELENFDKMAFIEPFSCIAHDYIMHMIRSKKLFTGILSGAPEEKNGYSSLYIRRDQNSQTIFDELYNLYTGLKQEYYEIEKIFTDNHIDILTNRYIPRPLSDRLNKFYDFINQRDDVYSDKSRRALEYLSSHLVPAKIRPENNPRSMEVSGQIYITRGFAGAINFMLEKDKTDIRLDILPRIITTSGVTKTLLGPDLPTVIAKTLSPADNYEKNTQRSYYDLIVNFLQKRKLQNE
jgi:hypothetical protein